MSITTQFYGSLPDGRDVEEITLVHAGLVCKVITYGGILTELHTPDRTGATADVVLGLSSLEQYVSGHPFFGAITGRVAGRINGGAFELDGTRYQLALTQPPNHLHGGEVGLDKRVWTPATGETDAGEPFLDLRYTSPAGEEGYPGTVDIVVRYTLTNTAGLQIDYTATTDAPTPFSPTNHSYFNLAGEGSPSIADHTLQILADNVVWKNDEGTLAETVSPLEGTRHDFREAKSLTDFVTGDDPQHGENYILRDDDAAEPKRAAVVTDPSSGRVMEVLTTTTSLQLYTSQALGDDHLTGKSGKPYPSYSAICLECQGMPNGVNTPEIDDIILRPGTPYRQTTVYRFTTQ